MNGIPSELTDRAQWCVWAEKEDGTKYPLQLNGAFAKTNDPSTFATFEDVNNSGKPIAFIIQPYDPYTGIDLDNCLDEKGNLRDWAVPIAMRLDGIAYAEISPSGKGIKFLTKGKKTDGATCRKVFGPDKQQMEVYDFNRFWTITGNVYAGNKTIGEGQSVVDWICETHLAKPATSKSILTIQPNNKVERASRYLATMEPAISGQGGHNATFRAACKMVVGFDLSVDEAYHLLANEYNPRCDPEWSEKELRHKVEQANKQTGPRGDMLADYQSYDDVDLSGLEDVRKKIDRRPQLCDSLLMPDGLLGDMVRFIRETARYDLPEVILASCLAFSGMVLGRRVRAIDDTRPNLFCLSIAESGTGKNHPRQTIKRIMQTVGMDVPREGASSATAVARMLARNPSVVIQIDEAGLAFRAMKNPRSPQAELGALFSELFTSSNGYFSYRAYADSANETPVDQPHLSLNAITTEQQLYSGGFTHDDIEQGLFGRFLLFRPQNMDPAERFDIEVVSVPTHIIEQVKSWWDFQPWDRVAGANLQPDHPEPMVIPFSDAAKARYRSYAESITKKMKGEDTFRKALWRRSKEKTSRLALVHACMKAGHRGGIVIDRDSMDWAIAISNYSTRGMVYDMDNAMVESNYQANAQYFLSKIPDAGLDRWELNRKLRKFRPKEREEIFADMLQSGRIEVQEIASTTRVRQFIRRVS